MGLVLRIRLFSDTEFDSVGDPFVVNIHPVAGRELINKAHPPVR